MFSENDFGMRNRQLEAMSSRSTQGHRDGRENRFFERREEVIKIGFGHDKDFYVNLGKVLLLRMDTIEVHALSNSAEKAIAVMASLTEQGIATLKKTKTDTILTREGLRHPKVIFTLEKVGATTAAVSKEEIAFVEEKKPEEKTLEGWSNTEAEKDDDEAKEPYEEHKDDSEHSD